MKTMILVMSAAGLVLFGCGSSENQPDSDNSATAVTHTVEAACGSCIFEMEGVEGCHLAVKVDGKPYLVSGLDFDTHGSGLCKSSQPAEIKGGVEGDKFVASEIKIKP